MHHVGANVHELSLQTVKPQISNLYHLSATDLNILSLEPDSLLISECKLPGELTQGERTRAQIDVFFAFVLQSFFIVIWALVLYLCEYCVFQIGHEEK